MVRHFDCGDQIALEVGKLPLRRNGRPRKETRHQIPCIAEHQSNLEVSRCLSDWAHVAFDTEIHSNCAFTREIFRGVLMCKKMAPLRNCTDLNAADIFLCSSRRRSSSSATITTEIPCPANLLQIARPMPELAPVTRAGRGNVNRVPGTKTHPNFHSALSDFAPCAAAEMRAEQCTSRQTPIRRWRIHSKANQKPWLERNKNLQPPKSIR